MFQLKMPTVVYSGENALAQIPEIIGTKVKKTAIFSDKGILGAGLLELPLSLLKEMGVDVVLFTDLPTEPTCDEAQQVVDQFKASGSEFIIAIGGGSVMDIAKLASILGDDTIQVRDLLEQPLLGKKYLKTLMIPTTAGTGAEATPNSIVAVPEKELKVGIVNPEMIADAVILDGRMIQKLPRAIAASTGIDALAHAIECFTSNKATAFSNTFALEALDIILNNLKEACNNPEALESKTKMLIASFYGGVAITASGTTAVHALSYPLGGKYHIPHGVANAMMLAPVLRFNAPYCQEEFSQVYDRVAQEKNQGLTVGEKSQWVINQIEDLVHTLNIPTSLQSYGVDKKDLDALVTAGMEVQRLLQNNKRPVTAEDARALYLEIL